MNRFVRRAAVGAVAALLLVSAVSASGRAATPRTVVLGFDGASADRTEKLLAEGKLPNLAALAKRGGWSKLATSNPAQSPVSWAVIETGTNPGKTGIYDFLKRTWASGGANVHIDIGLVSIDLRTPLSDLARAGLVFGAGLVGAAAGVGVILALYAGKRRAKRPRGLLQGTMTGVGALFACVAYVVLAWIPMTVPYAVNQRDGSPFWKTADGKGVRWVALEAPLSFPADEMECGDCLSGLGVPDVQGTWGRYATWTEDPGTTDRSEMGGVTYFLEPGAKSFDLVLPGPKNPLADPDVVRDSFRAADIERNKRDAAFDWTLIRRRASETKGEILELADRVAAHVAVTIERGKSVQLTTAEGLRVNLAPGVWSELVPVVFRMSPVVKIHANARFLLQSAGSARPAADGEFAPFKLFVAPVQFDAAQLPPNAQIASPMSFAKDLAAANGPFETLGWPELNSPVKDDVIADRDFLSHIEIVRKGREKRLFERLARSDWDCLFAMFSEPDRVQHALYRHVDEKSPRHDKAAAAEFAGEIDRAYVEMDRLVGEVAAKVGPDVRILVVSDHGFAPFRRGVNLNNFLCSQKLMTRSGNGGPGTMFNMQGFADVKWPETKAYAMGLGNLYLNLKGREPEGCVDPNEAETVMRQIESGLLALRDVNGEKVVRHVYRGKDLYHGARAADAPDLVVGFEWGYRVSWQNALGSVDDDVITDNKFRWSGDHCSVDPELVPGILFSSVPLDPAAKPGVADVAPSVLSLYGIASPDTDGKSFLAR
jgi:predicted AlkP superfamily phosphohydrolase/phosphomutase